MSDKTEKKQENPNLFKKGQSGNPKGRPKGTSGGLKDFDRQRFYKMTDDEKVEFLDKIAPEVRYKMAEGNPHQSNDTKVTVIPKPIMDVDKNNGVQKDNSNKKDNILAEED